MRNVHDSARLPLDIQAEHVRPKVIARDLPVRSKFNSRAAQRRNAPVDPVIYVLRQKSERGSQLILAACDFNGSSKGWISHGPS